MNFEQPKTPIQTLKEMRSDPDFSRFLKTCECETNPETAPNIILRFNQRKEAYKEMTESLKTRLEKEPLATQEELNAGVYKEYLEPQVRDAAFAMMKKGYVTFESGFYKTENNSQYIGFAKNPEFEKFEFPADVLSDFAEGEVEIKKAAEPDRDMIVLIPSKQLTLKEWKDIWDKLIEILPEVKPEQEKTIQKDFLEKQEKIKKGEDVYLGFGFSGLGIKDGKITENF